MDERVAVVDDYPLRVAITVIIVRLDSCIFKEIFADTVGHGCDVLGGCTFTDHKAACCCRVDVGSLTATVSSKEITVVRLSLLLA